MIHQAIHGFTIIFGIFLNGIALFAILRKTPKNLKIYSLLLFNTCIIESCSIIAHFLVNGRLFFSSKSIITISSGPCRSISDLFCSIVTDFMNLNMIHSGSLVAVSFWYRTQILLSKDPPGMWRLQLISIVLFIPHTLHIIGYALTTTSRNELEFIIDEIYHVGYSKEYGVYGYSDVSKPIPALFLIYTLVFPFSVYLYTAVTRNKLVSLLREKTKHMNERTRNTHESLAKALTIHAVMPFFVFSIFSVLTIAQIFYELHSPDIEGLLYDIAVISALINPALTLYFVRPYKMRDAKKDIGSNNFTFRFLTRLLLSVKKVKNLPSTMSVMN